MEILYFKRNLKLRCTKEQATAIKSILTLFGEDNVECIGWDDFDDKFVFGTLAFSINHQKPVHLAVEYEHPYYSQSCNEHSNTTIGMDVAENGQVHFSVFVNIDDVRNLIDD